MSAASVQIDLPANGNDAAVGAANGAGQAPQSAGLADDLPEEWAEIRADPAIQFAPIDRKELAPREPGWFEKWLDGVFEWLADLLGPVGRALAAGWPVIQYVLLALAIALVAYAAWRMIGPILREERGGDARGPAAEPEWRPDEAESRALLGDADALAAEGRFGEAVRLLLHRSVNQIRTARPDWVEPSSTARELAALPALSDAARGAFGTVSEAVERSLFALQSLDRQDWERARTAYADFALTRIDGTRRDGRA